MLIAIHGVKLYAHTYAWSEALCLMLQKEGSYMLIVVHELKLYAHCYTWCKALCSSLYM